jgi:hypothetical protein
LELACAARDIALKQSMTLSTNGLPIEGMFVLEYGELVKTKGK